MALTLGQVAVGTVPAMVGVLNPGGQVMLQPAGTVQVYVGTSTRTTTSNGYPLAAAGTAFSLPFTSGPSTLWAVASAVTAIGTAFTSAS